MRKWLVRIGIWLGVALLVSINVRACIDEGGSAEHRPTLDSSDILLNDQPPTK